MALFLCQKLSKNRSPVSWKMALLIFVLCPISLSLPCSFQSRHYLYNQICCCFKISEELKELQMVLKLQQLKALFKALDHAGECSSFTSEYKSRLKLNLHFLACGSSALVGQG